MKGNKYNKNHIIENYSWDKNLKKIKQIKTNFYIYLNFFTLYFARTGIL